MSDRRQKTKPKKGRPIEIPVPKREDFFRNLKKAAPKPPKGSSTAPRKP